MTLGETKGPYSANTKPMTGRASRKRERGMKVETFRVTSLFRCYSLWERPSFYKMTTLHTRLNHSVRGQANFYLPFPPTTRYTCNTIAPAKRGMMNFNIQGAYSLWLCFIVLCLSYIDNFKNIISRKSVGIFFYRSFSISLSILEYYQQLYRL